MSVLTANNLSYYYEQGKDKVNILSGLDLAVEANESVAIIGVSGTGKSTLLHLLGGLDLPTDGEVLIHNQAFSKASDTQRGNLRNQHLGFVYQFHHLLPEFSALENVMMPLYLQDIDLKEAKDKAHQLLDKIGLGKRAKHKPSELSGGERQRVAIARAMITNPSCILADEPTGNLDSKTAHAVLDLLFELQQTQNTALLIVTHDDSIAKNMDRTYQLVNQKLVPLNA